VNEETLEFIEQVDMSGKINGVVIGVLLGFANNHKPLVAFSGNQKTTGLEAHTTTTLNVDDIGKKVALLFEGGDPNTPLIVGRIQNPEEIIQPNKPATQIELDHERLEFKANQEIVLRCGKSSITLTKSGKIILRGKYLLSRSSGVNRIKGGSVQIN